tara:strand:+ start:324 stop:665 length:342 start_codon:yes stop_codon:yes gene_type:complete
LSSLSKKSCVPCRGGIPPLTENEYKPLLTELGDEWEVIDTHHLEKTILLKNFTEALTLTNQVGSIAEKEGHHPDIELGWGRVKIIIWTHKIDGLSESDFILAAKISAIGKIAA